MYLGHIKKERRASVPPGVQSQLEHGGTAAQGKHCSMSIWSTALEPCRASSRTERVVLLDFHTAERIQKCLLTVCLLAASLHICPSRVNVIK